MVLDLGHVFPSISAVIVPHGLCAPSGLWPCVVSELDRNQVSIARVLPLLLQAHRSEEPTQPVEGVDLWGCCKRPAGRRARLGAPALEVSYSLVPQP